MLDLGVLEINGMFRTRWRYEYVNREKHREMCDKIIVIPRTKGGGQSTPEVKTRLMKAVSAIGNAQNNSATNIYGRRCVVEKLAIIQLTARRESAE